jgi:RsiW-degrading membrane proteinase PrsW (M82 family)
MTLAPIPPLLAVLFCAALFILLFQYIFPRPASWKLVGAAVVAGMVCTFLLSIILRRFVAPGPSGLEALSTLSTALPFAILRVGLPEEGAKALAAMIALAPFWRRATPAAAFQACLFVAVGFAIVENQGYATVFSEAAVLIAFGRGFLATLTHSLLAMIFGAFLMRFVARGWRHWHLPVVGFLVAAGCHALYDAGLLPILAEHLKAMRAGSLAKVTVSIPTILNAAPFVIGGIALVLVAGLWSLRSAIRRAACDDLITTEARHRAVVRRWRWSANTMLVLGGTGLLAAIAWAVFAESPPTDMPADTPDLRGALIGAIGFATAFFALILSWVLRQKR